MKRKQEITTTKIYPPLPLVVGKAVVLGREAKLSLWAEFRPFVWEDHC
jgi:hypothetical protein